MWKDLESQLCRDYGARVMISKKGLHSRGSFGSSYWRFSKCDFILAETTWSGPDFIFVFPNSSFSVMMLFLGKLYPMVPLKGLEIVCSLVLIKWEKENAWFFQLLKKKKWELYSNMDSLWQVPSFVPSTVAKEMRLKWGPQAHLGSLWAWDRSIPPKCQPVM